MIEPSTELLDTYVALLEQQQSLLRSISDLERACSYWCNEAKRARRRFRRLIVVSSTVIAALAAAHVARSL